MHCFTLLPTMAIIPALYVSAQATIASTSNTAQGSMASTTAYLSSTSTSTSVYAPSSVPFNTGPDPFPIVLPSTVTLTFNPFSTTSASQSHSSDPYSVPERTEGQETTNVSGPTAASHGSSSMSSTAAETSTHTTPTTTSDAEASHTSGSSAGHSFVKVALFGPLFREVLPFVWLWVMLFLEALI